MPAVYAQSAGCRQLPMIGKGGTATMNTTTNQKERLSQLADQYQFASRHSTRQEDNQVTSAYLTSCSTFRPGRT